MASPSSSNRFANRTQSVESLGLLGEQLKAHIPTPPLSMQQQVEEQSDRNQEDDYQQQEYKHRVELQQQEYKRQSMSGSDPCILQVGHHLHTDPTLRSGFASPITRSECVSEVNTPRGSSEARQGSRGLVVVNPASLLGYPNPSSIATNNFCSIAPSPMMPPPLGTMSGSHTTLLGSGALSRDGSSDAKGARVSRTLSISSETSSAGVAYPDPGLMMPFDTMVDEISTDASFCSSGAVTPRWSVSCCGAWQTPRVGSIGPEVMNSSSLLGYPKSMSFRGGPLDDGEGTRSDDAVSIVDLSIADNSISSRGSTITRMTGSASYGPNFPPPSASTATNNFCSIAPCPMMPPPLGTMSGSHTTLLGSGALSRDGSSDGKGGRVSRTLSISSETSSTGAAYPDPGLMMPFDTMVDESSTDASFGSSGAVTPRWSVSCCGAWQTPDRSP